MGLKKKGKKSFTEIQVFHVNKMILCHNTDMIWYSIFKNIKLLSNLLRENFTDRNITIIVFFTTNNMTKSKSKIKI